MSAILLKEARVSKEQLDVIRYRLKTGELTYDKAKLLAEKPLKIMNIYMKQRAKDFGVKHRATHFIGFMR